MTPGAIDIAQTPHLTIGALSKATGCIVETIRYYERIGLMPDPRPSGTGRRLYKRDHLKRLTFIRRARELGFSLHEVRVLLGLVDGGDYSCSEVRTLALEQLAKIRGRIADLGKMERVLSDMASKCEDLEIPECPVIDALFEGSA
ncbi:MAG: helix-turn-helix domain-containing protein [Sphingomonadales bacterium]